MSKSQVGYRTFLDFVENTQEAATYRRMHEREDTHLVAALSRYESEVRLWMRGLSLYEESMIGEWDVIVAPADAAGAMGVIRQILGLGLDTAKGTLDSILAGHFSLGLSGCRHLLESAVQIRYLHYVPKDYQRWANDARQRTPSFSAMRDALKRHDHFTDASEMFDAVYKNLDLYSKGAHPTGIGLRQTRSTDNIHYILGVNEQRVELAEVGLLGGLQALSYLLLEIQMARPITSTSLIQGIDQFSRDVEALIDRQQTGACARVDAGI